MGFPGGSDSKDSAYNTGDPGLIPGLGRFPWEGNDNPHQCSCLENSMDRRVWQALVHEVAKSWTRLKWLTHTQSFIMKSFNQFPHACYFMEPWTNKVMMHLTTGKEVFSVFSAVRFSFGQCFNLHRLPSQIPQTGVLNNRSFFSVSEAGSPKLRRWLIQCLMRALFQLADNHLLQSFSSACMWRESKIHFSS